MKDTLRCREAIQYLSGISDEPDLKIILDNWPTIEEIEKVLSFASNTTTELERATLTLSDLYGALQKLIFYLNRFANNSTPITNLANDLLERISIRKTKLLEHPLMKAALYLDPRYIGDMTDDEIKIAKYYLQQCHKRIVEVMNSTPEIDDPLDDSYDRDLKAKRRRIDGNNSEYTDSSRLTLLFTQYEKNLPRMSSKDNILQYWETRKLTDPELWQLACLVMTVAPTQVTVERAFSILRHIVNNRRTRLDPRMIENILFINLNKEMVASINESDLRKLETNI